LRELMTSIGKPWPAPDGLISVPRCSRSTLLSLDERDNVSFCRTVALDISLGHRKRGMSSHLLDVAKRSTCLCNPLRDGCDEASYLNATTLPQARFLDIGYETISLRHSGCSRVLARCKLPGDPAKPSRLGLPSVLPEHPRAHDEGGLSVRQPCPSMLCYEAIWRRRAHRSCRLP
jgi:hypothetical protein